MAGALDGLAVKPELLSYEGTFGVGYGVAVFTATGSDESRRFAAQCEELERVRLAERKAAEDPWVQLARLSLETYVKAGPGQANAQDGAVHPCFPEEVQGKKRAVIQGGLLLSQRPGLDIGFLSPADQLLPQFSVIQVY